MITTERAQAIIRDLLEDITTIATRSDRCHIIDGIQYLHDHDQDDYAFLVELKLQDRQKEHHRIHLGYNTDGLSKIQEYFGFDF